MYTNLKRVSFPAFSTFSFKLKIYIQVQPCYKDLIFFLQIAILYSSSAPFSQWAPLLLFSTTYQIVGYIKEETCYVKASFFYQTSNLPWRAALGVATMPPVAASRRTAD